MLCQTGLNELFSPQSVNMESHRNHLRFLIFIGSDGTRGNAIGVSCILC